MLKEFGLVQVGVDYDGVIIQKANSKDLIRRATKIGLPLMPDAIDGLNFIRRQPDTNMLGIYTVRPAWLREGQTRRQVEKRKIPVRRIVHTTNSSRDKIRELLLDSINYRGERNSDSFDKKQFAFFKGVEIANKIRAEHLLQAVLIDDSTEKIVDAASELWHKEPILRPLLARFTHIAFNPEQSGRVQGMIIPGVVHVITMRDWSEIAKAMEQIRR